MIRKSGTHLTKAALQFYEQVHRFFENEKKIAQQYAITLPER